VIYECVKCGREYTEKQRYSTPLKYELFLLELTLYNPKHIYKAIQMHFMTEHCNGVLSNARPEHRLQVCFKKEVAEVLGDNRHGTS
jgi:hypothetical protein